MHPINKILSKFNLKIIKISSPSNKYIFNNDIKLNIGSGDWSYTGWTNLDHPSEYYKKLQKDHDITAFNIREDNIPFNDDEVSIIYCSHVIEHIEDKHIQSMFNECFRVLKTNGIIRVACPDADFLYEISKLETNYWDWRKKWFLKSTDVEIAEKCRNVDFLVREIGTPKLLFYEHSINQDDYIRQFNTYDKYSFFEYITNDLKYRAEYPGDHINYWTFEKVRKMLNIAGFNFVIRSKYMGSCNNEMKNIQRFDTTYPNMSLYVEAIKEKL